MRLTSSALPTSPCAPATRPLAPALIDLTAASSASRPRAAISTSAPEAAKRLAMAKPSPLLPPVTMAARLARSICMQAPKDTLIRHVDGYEERPGNISGQVEPSQHLGCLRDAMLLKRMGGSADTEPSTRRSLTRTYAL